MAPTRIELRTEDGVCPAYVFRPEGKGPFPGVLFFMDGIGIRPALFEMGERLAKHGYYALLPDLFYRVGPYEPMNAKTVFSDPAQRAALMSKFMPAASASFTMRDTKAFLAHLRGEQDVKQGRFGVHGYCMGGRLALTAAGTYPDDFAAAAAYHPGHVANDAPESPHLLAPKMKAQIYVGGASEDPSFPEEQKKRLGEALTAAHVQHVIETYPARHGWVPSDTPSHDAACAERHWKTLFALYDRTLRA